MGNSLIQQSEAARGNILSSLKAAQNTNEGPVLSDKCPVRVFSEPRDLLSTFKDELTKIKGKVLEFSSDSELVSILHDLKNECSWDKLFTRDTELLNLLKSNMPVSSDQDDLVEMKAGITRCEFLVARSGSVVVSSAQPSGRLMNIFPPMHIVVAKVSQLVPFLDDAIDGIKVRYKHNIPSQVTVITGASRTADIEKTLVMGAHGPKELIVLVDTNT